jgi:tryptophan-rich sensory protein
VLSTGTAAWLSVAICVAAALIEGLCAGRQVRPFFKQVRLPRYSAPLWLWSLIGAAYYFIFGFVVYRLLSHVPASGLTRATLALIGAMMLGNALSNLVIFRARNLRLSGMIGDAYALLDILLVLVVTRIDSLAAWALAPYLAYRVYAVWWGHMLAELNPSS